MFSIFLQFFWFINSSTSHQSSFRHQMANFFTSLRRWFSLFTDRFMLSWNITPRPTSNAKCVSFQFCYCGREFFTTEKKVFGVSLVGLKLKYFLRFVGVANFRVIKLLWCQLARPEEYSCICEYTSFIDSKLSLLEPSALICIHNVLSFPCIYSLTIIRMDIITFSAISIQKVEMSSF